jgi:hypothetical protein
MAREAGVPFLFVSATSFQSMWYGATAKKIRSYFKALRKAARKEGGAIGFIEEIDAIAMTRGGMAAMTPISGTPFSVVHGCSGTACLPSSLATPAMPSSLQVGRGRLGHGHERPDERGHRRRRSTSCSCRCRASTTRPAGARSAAGSSTGSTC